jgi:hypothetical protein
VWVRVDVLLANPLELFQALVDYVIDASHSPT